MFQWLISLAGYCVRDFSPAFRALATQALPANVRLFMINGAFTDLQIRLAEIGAGSAGILAKAPFPT
jgi:hypothetical protein